MSQGSHVNMHIWYSSIDLLMMGENDAVMLRLLHYGSQFAHRSVLHSHQAELTGCFRREDNNHFIDGKIVCAHVQYTMYILCVYM